MTQLTPDGQRIVQDLSNRHGFSTDAVTHMLFAVLNGNGGMAQFSHGEFAGSGQWMRGGMIMLGDMFNNYLKGRVDSLCSEIANILASQPGLLQTGSFQSQSQGGYNGQHQSNGGGMGQSSLFVPNPEDNWWPSEIGIPNARGSQNNVKYAYFAQARRLAVKTGSDVWVYDTQDHQIGGFSQQQGVGGTITFSSQFGTVVLSQLPAISRNGQPLAATPPPPAVTSQPYNSQPMNFSPQNNSASSSNSASTSNSADVISALEKLGDLKAKGILTDSEFSEKKAQLLSRL
jgi:Short C-terminal domain